MGGGGRDSALEWGDARHRRRPAVAALRAYLAVRGPASALPEQVFVYRHRPLARYYCYRRLHTYGKRCACGSIRTSCAITVPRCSSTRVRPSSATCTFRPRSTMPACTTAPSPPTTSRPCCRLRAASRCRSRSRPCSYSAGQDAMCVRASAQGTEQPLLPGQVTCLCQAVRSQTVTAHTTRNICYYSVEFRHRTVSEIAIEYQNTINKSQWP